MAGAFDEAVTTGRQRKRTIMEMLADLLQAEAAHSHDPLPHDRDQAAGDQGPQRLRLRRHAHQRGPGPLALRRELPAEPSQHCKRRSGTTGVLKLRARSDQAVTATFYVA